MINYALSVHLNQPLYLLFVQVLIFTNTGVMVPLPWFTRMKIALGAAKGLAFLHEAEKPVIYRDFKTSNILLDEVDGVFFFDLNRHVVISHLPNIKISCNLQGEPTLVSVLLFKCSYSRKFMPTEFNDNGA